MLAFQIDDHFTPVIISTSLLYYFKNFGQFYCILIGLLPTSSVKTICTGDNFVYHHWEYIIIYSFIVLSLKILKRYRQLLIQQNKDDNILKAMLNKAYKRSIISKSKQNFVYIFRQRIFCNKIITYCQKIVKKSKKYPLNHFKILL